MKLVNILSFVAAIFGILCVAQAAPVHGAVSGSEGINAAIRQMCDCDCDQEGRNYCTCDCGLESGQVLVPKYKWGPWPKAIKR